jgi:two-component system, NtrC family, nitrogen regulation response regulator GlnG
VKSPVAWIVDDEPAICWSLRKALENRGMRVSVFSDAESAIAALRSKDQPCDTIITDVRLPHADGFSVVDAVAKVRPGTPVVLMTAFGDLSTAVKAMKANVFEYLVKPFDLQDAIRTIEKAIDSVVSKSLAPLQQSIDFTVPINEVLLLGNSAAIQNTYRQIAIASRSNQPVLISGPDGTPIESVAASIHRHSERSQRPFLSVKPASIPIENLEREFVGNVQDDPRGETLKTGLFGLAGEGSLFVAEAFDLPSSVQSQLLQVLEDSMYTPHGSATTRRCSARILIGTHHALEDHEEFDPSLLQRLRVMQIDVPPLGSRREDAILVAQAIANRLNTNCANGTFSPSAMHWISTQEWPGDVRQLRNVVEKAIALYPNQPLDLSNVREAYEQIEVRTSRQPADEARDRSIAAIVKDWLNTKLAEESKEAGSANDFGMLYDEFLALVEPPLLEEMLKRLSHNRAATATKLGLHRSTLRQKMRRYGID